MVHKGNGLSLTYTNKDANGVYTAPAGAGNKLVQNADSTWSETNLDGGELRFDTSGKLAKVIEGDRTWTVSYDGGSRVSQVADPAGRNSAFIYMIDFSGTRLRRFVDANEERGHSTFQSSRNAGMGTPGTDVWALAGAQRVLSQTATSEFGAIWTMTYRQRVIVVNSTTAVVHGPQGDRRLADLLEQGRLGRLHGPGGSTELAEVRRPEQAGPERRLDLDGDLGGTRRRGQAALSARAVSPCRADRLPAARVAWPTAPAGRGR